MEKNHIFIASNETLDELSQEFIFHKILKSTENEPSFLPMLMYALYKQDKVKFIVQEKNIDTQNEIEKERLIRFQKIKMSDQNIEEYKKQANEILENTVNNLLTKKEKNIEEKEVSLIKKERELETKEKDLRKQEKDLRKQEKDLKKRNLNCPKSTPFWHGILQSLIASIIMITITAVILLINDRNIAKQIYNIFSTK